jgi:uncharacterized membrane protein YeaQ/YmgE (transglycosylase-associated protein family)
MHLLWTIIIGFVIGLVARALKPGRDKMGLIMTTLLGIGGALVAKFVGQQLGWYRPYEAAGFIASVVGAIVLLLLFGLVRGRRGL